MYGGKTLEGVWDEGMEGWKDEGMDGRRWWRDGGMEGWKDEGMEGWRVDGGSGGMEGWGDLVLFFFCWRTPFSQLNKGVKDAITKVRHANPIASSST